MCNYVVPMDKRNACEIPKQGIGYKLFWIHPTGELRPAFASGSYEEWDGWIVWDYNYGSKEEAFCFFLDLKKAKEYTSVYLYKEIYKIQYEEGIQERDETNMGEKVLRVALCRKFKILEKVEI